MKTHLEDCPLALTYVEEVTVKFKDKIFSLKLMPPPIIADDYTRFRLNIHAIKHLNYLTHLRIDSRTYELKTGFVECKVQYEESIPNEIFLN